MQAMTKGFGIIGLILLVFGVIALALTKLVNWYFYLHAGLGSVLIILYLVFNLETFLERIKERSTAEGGKVFVYAGIVVLIIVGLNVIGARKSKTWDLTENKIFSLEQQTRDVLGKLKQPLSVVAFFHDKNPAKEALKQRLETYQRESEQFKFEFVDPDKQPDLANQAKVKDGDIRIVYGGEDKVIKTFNEESVKQAVEAGAINALYFGQTAGDENFAKLRDLVQQINPGAGVRYYPADSPPPGLDVKPVVGTVVLQYPRKDTVIQDFSEQSLTNAIVQVSVQDSPIVYFATGHGERGLEDDSEKGLSVLKGAIRNEGYDVRELKNGFAAGIPEDTKVLVVAGSVSPYSEAEANTIDRFLAKGGKLVLLSDPHFSSSKLNPKVEVIDSGLETLAAKWGVKLGKDVVLEKHEQFLVGVTTDPYVLAQTYGDHEITKPIARASTYFNVVRSVRKSETAPPDLSITELIKSSPGKGTSWSENNIDKLLQERQAEFDEGDVGGPVPIALVAEKEAADRHTKLAVFGDVDFVSNRYIRTYENNYDLFLNTLNWMADKQDQITIRPKQLRSSKLLLTANQTNTIFYSAVLAIPELVLILGLVIYWRRRSR